MKSGDILQRVAQLHHLPNSGNPVEIHFVVTPLLPEEEIHPGIGLQTEMDREVQHALILIVQNLPERGYEDTLPRRQRNRLGIVLK